jgi:hypothetical protein
VQSPLKLWNKLDNKTGKFGILRVCKKRFALELEQLGFFIKDLYTFIVVHVLVDWIYISAFCVVRGKCASGKSTE